MTRWWWFRACKSPSQETSDFQTSSHANGKGITYFFLFSII